MEKGKTSGVNLMDELFAQRFDGIEKKLDVMLESQEQYRKESREDREKLIRIDQSLTDYKHFVDTHVTCQGEECKKNHKALYDNIMRKVYAGLVIIGITIIGFFATKWMNSVESVKAKTEGKHETNSVQQSTGQF